MVFDERILLTHRIKTSKSVGMIRAIIVTLFLSLGFTRIAESFAAQDPCKATDDPVPSDNRIGGGGGGGKDLK